MRKYRLKMGFKCIFIANRSTCLPENSIQYRRHLKNISSNIIPPYPGSNANFTMSENTRSSHAQLHIFERILRNKLSRNAVIYTTLPQAMPSNDRVYSALL
jgi:hypothetical protein